MIYIGVQIVSGRGPIDFPIPCGKISLLPFTHSFQYFWSINMSLLWITMPTWFLHWLMSKIKSLTYICACTLSRFSHVQLFETPWTIARQAPLTMGFSRQEYWSGLPSPPPGDLPHVGIKPTSPASPALQADSLPLSHQRSPLTYMCTLTMYKYIYIYNIYTQYKYVYIIKHIYICKR